MGIINLDYNQMACNPLAVDLPTPRACGTLILRVVTGTTS